VRRSCTVGFNVQEEERTIVNGCDVKIGSIEVLASFLPMNWRNASAPEMAKRQKTDERIARILRV